MGRNVLTTILVGTFLWATISLDVALAFEMRKVPGVEVGYLQIEGERYTLQFVEGWPSGTYHQIVFYDASGNAIATLAFKNHFEAIERSDVAVVENPLPIVVGETSIHQLTLFDALYAGLFLYLLQTRPEAVKEGLQINFTDVPKGVAHPAITFPLQKFGFEAVGGQTVTLQLPQRANLPIGTKRFQIPLMRAIKIGLSNQYTLSDLSQFRSTLTGILAGATN